MKAQPQLTIGPILFHWPAETKRDFYYRIADECDVSTIYIGEVICSKRAPFFEKHYPEIIERLQSAGKTVVLSTLSEVMIKHDRKMTESACKMDMIEVEANDTSALYHLSGRPHRIGQLMNVYNEDTLFILAKRGATHFCLNPEIPQDALAVLGKAAKKVGVKLEYQVFGRMSLALSARCYHARAYGRIKDNCQFVCEEDPDGMDLKTLDGKTILSVNGIQTLSHTYLNLMHELPALEKNGITHFRISPHNFDIIETCRLFSDVLHKKTEPESACQKLQELGINAPFSNGFYHKNAGYAWHTHFLKKDWGK
ncbi:MAG: U32 family peptidase [Pseudobdellovibrionaceae bacterium]